jgi:hypothetical protein
MNTDRAAGALMGALIGDALLISGALKLKVSCSIFDAGVLEEAPVRHPVRRAIHECTKLKFLSQGAPS